MIIIWDNCETEYDHYPEYYRAYYRTDLPVHVAEAMLRCVVSMDSSCRIVGVARDEDWRIPSVLQTLDPEASLVAIQGKWPCGHSTAAWDILQNSLTRDEMMMVLRLWEARSEGDPKASKVFPETVAEIERRWPLHNTAHQSGSTNSAAASTSVTGENHR